MLMEQERELIVKYGKKLISSGLTKGTGGNLSIYNKKEGLIAISPSGMDYFETTPLDITIMDLKGNLVEGERKPSVEYEMHLIFYKNRKNVFSVVHTHSIASSTIAALRWSLPAVNYLVGLSGENLVPCADYASFGSKELAENALKGMGNGYAVFLANHGLLTTSTDIHKAFYIAEEIEHCAEIFLRAKAVGNPVIISDEEMVKMNILFKSYGQNK
ncbi:L-fuculose-phosphate aldolase [Anaerovorax odorimutans]|uniref:L-fuculose-phosphate aldolase n=1 Tax=Anaerovorax odorimutans TaxID=109327 RepID=UPI00041F0C5B|nr:L-fuculose-phosphate aldolase [Anaerovorax odorimutans]